MTIWILTHINDPLRAGGARNIEGVTQMVKGITI
jgi:hypothetical protein